MNLFRQMSYQPVVCHLDSCAVPNQMLDLSQIVVLASPTNIQLFKADPSNYALSERNALQLTEFIDRQIFSYLGNEIYCKNVSSC